MKKAFTLVELIVVITILAILWIIAFIELEENKTILDEDCVMDYSEEIKEFIKDCNLVGLYNCKNKAYEEYRCLDIKN